VDEDLLGAVVQGRDLEEQGLFDAFSPLRNTEVVVPKLNAGAKRIHRGIE
jgi:hypothetical protein